MNNKLYWVIPCYNEEDCLPNTSPEFINKLNELIHDGLASKDSRLVFVDDGSKDKTWELIEKLNKEHKIVNGVKLSRNKGHQFACEAGLEFSIKNNADLTITMDCDLQDNIDVVNEMVKDYLEGIDVVYGVRNSRKTDSFFKKFTADSYYRLMKKMGVELVSEAADFRLLSKRATEALLSYHEANLFLRGIVPNIGFPSKKVEYERLKRTSGSSKYSLKKMLRLAFDGITSFSVKPLSLVTNVGVWTMVLSCLCALTFMVLHLTKVLDFSIYYYLFPFVSFFAGLIILMIGVVGLYVGRIGIEVKHRPHYFVEKTLSDK